MKATLRMLLAGVLLALTVAQSRSDPGDVDLGFDPGSSINGYVYAVSVLSDGKILIGGNFTTVSGVMRGGLARLNADGSTDLTFMNGQQGAAGDVEAVAVQADGKIVVAGGFRSFSGVARGCIVRLNPDGALDTTFDTRIAGGIYPVARSLSLQSDGRILVGGWFGTVNGIARTNLVRLNADGTLDETFTANVGAGGESGVFALRLASDGKILTGGNFTLVNGFAQTNLARLNQNGSLDGSFVVDVAVSGGTVRSLAVQSDGRVVIGGSPGMVVGIPLQTIARLNSDGSLDRTFTASIPGDFNGIQAMEVQSDGKIVIAGDFWMVDGVARSYLARLNPDGTSDGTFLSGLSGPDDWVWALALQTDGKIVVGGQFGLVNGVQRLMIARLQRGGALDETFSIGAGGPNGFVEALAVQDDTKVLVGGLFSTFDGQPRRGLARLNTHGSLDSSWQDPELGGEVFCLRLQPDGKILVGGENIFVRLNPDGSRDDAFKVPLNGGNTSPYVRSLAIQPDGKILVAGTFSSIGDGTNASLARLYPDGSVDRTFLRGMIGVDNSVYWVAVQNDGKILVRGFFLFVNGVLRNGFARLNADGSLDPSFAYPPDGYAPENFALQRDGKILIGVNLGSGGGYGIKRLNADGTLDTAFLNGAVSVNNDCWMSITIQSDGKILMAGCFTTLNGMPCGRVARLNPDGSLDGSFTEGRSGADSDVVALALQGDSGVILGGLFSSVNHVPRRYVARLATAAETAPLITRPPLSFTAETGTSGHFRVEARGAPPLQYVWSFNGTTLPGPSNNNFLRLDAVEPSQTGSYMVVVSNDFGAVTSPPAMLNVIQPVERRSVPALRLPGPLGVALHVEVAGTLSPTPTWLALETVTVTSPAQFYFDLTTPLPPQRFYRTWQAGAPAVYPSGELQMVPALTLTGNIGGSVRVDYINQFGPTDAWFTLDTVTLTNTPQLYFDVSAPGQPPRLYRVVQVP